MKQFQHNDAKFQVSTDEGRGKEMTGVLGYTMC